MRRAIEWTEKPGGDEPNVVYRVSLFAGKVTWQRKLKDAEEWWRRELTSQNGIVFVECYARYNMGINRLELEYLGLVCDDCHERVVMKMRAIS